MDVQRVLVVDTDFEARLLVSRILESGGYLTTAAANPEEALAALRAERHVSVLLEAQLGDGDGFDCCRRIREFSNVPVVMVSSLTDTANIVRGLDTGADDYVTKPFDRDELLARVRAAARRGGERHRVEPPLALPTIDVGPMHLDFSAQIATIGGADLNLSGKELLLLYLLAQNVGMLLSRGHIFQAVWGDDVYDDSKTLDVHISRLRKKLDMVGEYGNMLKTIRNRGYMLSSEMERAEPPKAKTRRTSR